MVLDDKERTVKKNALLTMLRSKEIKLDEFLTKCAEWTVEECHLYTWLPIPPKPKEVIEYEQIPPDERRSLNSEYFRDNPKITDYYDEVSRIRGVNHSLMKWLIECTKLVKSAEHLAKLEAKIDECNHEVLLVNSLIERR